MGAYVSLNEHFHFLWINTQKSYCDLPGKNSKIFKNIFHPTEKLYLSFPSQWVNRTTPFCSDRTSSREPSHSHRKPPPFSQGSGALIVKPITLHQHRPFACLTPSLHSKAIQESLCDFVLPSVFSIGGAWGKDSSANNLGGNLSFVNFGGPMKM